VFYDFPQPSKYKIIIPKEETKRETLDRNNHLISLSEVKEEETIEEVAERILANNIDGLKDALNDDDLFFFYKGVIQCYGEAMAKWQQERSYSEEEVLELLCKREWCYEHTIPFISVDDWFEQNKKK